jgi:sulfonate transport system permease protein
MEKASLGLKDSFDHLRQAGAGVASIVPAPSARSRRPVTLRRIAAGWRGLVVPALALGAWEAAAHWPGGNRVIFPPLETIARTAVALSASGDLWLNLGSSVLRVLAGFALAAIGGLALGTLTALFPWFERIVGSPLHAIRQVPLFGWIPLIAILAGIGEPSKIAFVVLAAIYPVVLNTAEGLRQAPAEYIEVARLYRLGRWQILRRVLWPSALPAILTGLKHGLNFAGVAVVGAEVFMTAAPGLGNLLDYGQTIMRADIVLVGVGLIGLLGFSLNLVLTALERRLLRWRGRPS